MKREIIKIDEEKCNGCGLCIPNCHEGALQIIDGKARLISDLMCDGLGACLGHCPEGALAIEEREAEEYDEVEVMKEMVSKGKNVVIAHLKHLKDHKEFDFLKQGVGYLKENKDNLNFDMAEVINEVHNYHPNANDSHTHNEKPEMKEMKMHHHEGGCPGSQSMAFSNQPGNQSQESTGDLSSQLTHWPVQMHLINPAASHFASSDLLLAADCVAFSAGNFHEKFLKGKTLAIACPKLDANKEIYVQKLIKLIDDAKINTLSVMIMEVPCCGGLLQMAQTAVQSAERKVPIKSVTISIQGEIIDESWI